MPEVSYILTTKDRPSQAQKFLKNLTALKRPGDEVIVVEASEKPYSPDIFGDVATKLIIGPDRSIAHGLNRGILASTKPYIKLLMDDDWFVPDATHRAFAIMEEHGIHAMQCGGKRWRVVDHPEHIGKYDSITDEGVNWGSHPSNVNTYGSTGVGQFFSREAFAIGGIIDTRFLLWDMELMARIISSGATVKYCRLYTYEHPLTMESTLLNPSMQEQKVKENYWLAQAHGLDWARARSKSWKHMTCEEARYDGAFA